MTQTKKDKQAEVDLSLIDEPDGILRLEIDQGYISELAQSIKEIGLLQPILLAVHGERYEIVAGHCRYLAHQKAGLPRIKAIVRDMTRDEIVIARATENLNRKDLTPVEEAMTYNSLHVNHNMTYAEIGKKIGKSAGLVKRRCTILRMPPQLQEYLHAGRISVGVAEELWPISDLAHLDYLLMFALDGGCTVTVARQWCKDWNDVRRHQQTDIDFEGDVVSPYEPRPTFMTCDVCNGPVELGRDKIIRACPECAQTIKIALQEVKR